VSGEKQVQKVEASSLGGESNKKKREIKIILTNERGQRVSTVEGKNCKNRKESRNRTKRPYKEGGKGQRNG